MAKKLTVIIVKDESVFFVKKYIEKLLHERRRDKNSPKKMASNDFI